MSFDIIKFTLIHRLPIQGRIRTEWIEAISQYQEHDFYGYFVICENHFITDDFYVENGEKNLKEGVVPTVFPLPQDTSDLSSHCVQKMH